MSLLSIAEKALNYFPSPARSLAERLLRSDVGMRLARGVFWNGLSGVATRIILMAAPIVVARILDRQHYGEFGMICSTMGMLSTFAGLGIGITTTKYVAELRDSDPARAGRIIGLSHLFTLFSGFCVSLTMFLIMPWLATNIIAAPHLVLELRIATLGPLFGAVSGSQAGVLSGLEAFRANSIISAALGLMTAFSTVIGALGGGLTGAVWGSVLPLAVSTMLYEIVVRRHSKQLKIRIDYLHATRELSVIWRFALPTFLTGLMAWPANWVSLAILSNMPEGYSQLGIFYAANQWYGALVLLPSAFGAAMLPILSNQQHAAPTGQYTRVVKFTSISTLVFASLPAVVMALMAKNIMALYGASFIIGWPVLIACITTGVIHATMKPLESSLLASARVWALMGIQWLWGALFIASTYILRGNGALGLASARCIACLVALLILAALVKHIENTISGSKQVSKNISPIQ